MRRGIVGVGNWILDRVKLIDRWPQEGELCNILRQQTSAGGGPCNVLFDLAAMDCGIPLYAAGVLGRDGDGEQLSRQIGAKGIDARYISFSKSADTSSTDVMTVRRNGRRTFFHNRGANAELGYSHLNAIDVPAKIFYLGYLLLLDALDAEDPVYGTVAARGLMEMRKKGYRTAVDVVSEDAEKFQKIVRPALRHIDYLIINEVDAGFCSGCKVRSADGAIDSDALVSAARSLMEGGVQQLVVIHFPEGAIALEKNGVFYTVPSCRIAPEEIVGSVGAGDAFCAGLLYGLHEDLPVTESLGMASASAWFNLQCSSASGGAPTLSQLKAHLAHCEFNSTEWYTK